MSSIFPSETPAWRRDRQQRLVVAALDALRDRRLEAVSMDEIARSAGVGKATLYRYFESKQALLATCLATIVDDLGARMEAAETAEAPAGERLDGIVGAMVETFSTHLLPLQLLTRRQGDLEETWRQYVRDARGRLVAVLERHFDRGQAEGAYGELDRELLPHFVMGMIRSCVTHAGQPDRRITEGICAFIERAATAGQATHAAR